MKITHYICPRDSGKTTKAIELAKENPQGTILFTPLSEYVEKANKDIIVKKSGGSLMGYRQKRIIIDDFLDLIWGENVRQVDRARMFAWINQHVMDKLLHANNAELILLSTSPRLFRRDAMMLLCISEHIYPSNFQRKPDDVTKFQYAKESTASYYFDFLNDEQLAELERNYADLKESFLNPWRVDIRQTAFHIGQSLRKLELREQLSKEQVSRWLDGAFLTDTPLRTEDEIIKTIVKADHPKAECVRDGAMFFVRTSNKDLGAGFSENAAWRSAASFPEKKEKIVPGATFLS